MGALFDHRNALGWAGSIVLLIGFSLIGLGIGRELHGLATLRRSTNFALNSPVARRIGFSVRHGVGCKDCHTTQRYDQLLPAYTQRVADSVAHLPEHRRGFAVWTRHARSDEVTRLLAGQPLTVCRIGLPGHGLGGARPPMMILGEESSLGVYGAAGGRPRVSFASHTKPFNGDTWFYTQHLVASVTLLGGDEQHTFDPPYVLEWNEFYSRTMHFQYDRLRIEPKRAGIVIDAADYDAHLSALPTSDLMEKLFDPAGLTAAPSSGGLIARQLISRVGGVQGGRVFKIPGVRRLLKTHGPAAAVTMRAALQMIGERDPRNP
ncbi:MAG TPA: hypothetical protein VL614_09950, partial [Acetobacteraceae bacterium]|nr:hypothetical protein [Acetobacteraceae bacterium]